jgi:hypothetical protein
MALPDLCARHSETDARAIVNALPGHRRAGGYRVLAAGNPYRQPGSRDAIELREITFPGNHCGDGEPVPGCTTSDQRDIIASLTGA